jgi:two-component system, OmpR family, response regulator
MEAGPHLLIVDDDQELGHLLRRFMERHAFRVTVTKDAQEARSVCSNNSFSLAVLDLILPQESGLDLARWFCEQSEMPIIILSALSEDRHKISSLEQGADDYVTKPFSPRELLARIRAVLRRTSAAKEGTATDRKLSQPLRFMGWSLERYQRKLINHAGVEIPLTRGEYELLLVFLEHAHRILTREALLEAVGRQGNPLDRTVDVAVSRSRRKLCCSEDGSQLIKSVRGGGYIFAASVER